MRGPSLTRRGTPSLIVPGELVIAGDEDSPAVAIVVDVADHPIGTIVDLDVLPGTIDSYVALARRLNQRASCEPAL